MSAAPDIPSETVVTYTDNGQVFEIDHLGISRPAQWGLFAVYNRGGLVAEFSAGFDAALTMPDDELVQLARHAVAETTGE